MAGVASRRAAETLIAAGRVSVNGSVVTEMGTKVLPGTDRIKVDGEKVAVRQAVWVALNKPRRCVTARMDPQGRPTVYDFMPAKFRSLFHVGRLDWDSEGLLLFTNDGDLANKVAHPSHGVHKEYEVEVKGEVGANVAA